MGPFLGIERIALGPWQAFDRMIERLLVHGGWQNVRLVDGSGDGGADLVADAARKCWVIQCKFRSARGVFGAEPVEEVLRASQLYGADVAVVAVNGTFNQAARDLMERTRRNLGVDLRLWSAEQLIEVGRSLPDNPIGRPELRDYQAEAVEAAWTAYLSGQESVLLLLATGLGKTRVAAELIGRWLATYPGDEVLVLAHSLDLVAQLERSLWRYLPKGVPTHQLHGKEKPSFMGGVTIATQQSLQWADIGAQYQHRFGLVLVDEAHHAPADGYATVLELIQPKLLIGQTATPWRGDRRLLEAIFGEPVFTMGIVEGMMRGYLAQVDYRMLVDNIAWDRVPALTGHRLTVKDLNARLFLPTRDDAVIAKILEHASRIGNAKILVFTRSISHAEQFAVQLAVAGLSSSCVHSGKNRVEITNALHRFSKDSGSVALVTVDMLNEGIDLPDVNMVVFLRVTHSRRIFLQQLGRGLRLAPGKDLVLVLDFVADIRRIAAGMEMNSESLSKGQAYGTTLPWDKLVHFEGDVPLTLFEQYLADVGSLQDAQDDSQIHFPGS